MIDWKKAAKYYRRECAEWGKQYADLQDLWIGDSKPLIAEAQAPGLAYSLAIEWPESIRDFHFSAFRFESYLEDDLADARPDQVVRIFDAVAGWLHSYCHLCGEYNDFRGGRRGCEHKEDLWDRTLIGHGDWSRHALAACVVLFGEAVKEFVGDVDFRAYG